MFYLFDQNNSGGDFHHDSSNGIGYRVIIEADSADQANEIAENIGIYFNGCYDERDCPCCGDRWSPAYVGDGTECASEYGGLDTGGFGIPSYIHYENGAIVAIEDIKK